MKYRILLLLGFSTLLFSACKKNNTTTPQTVIKASMTFTVDGVPKTMDNVLATYTTTQSTPGLSTSIIIVEGATLSDEILSIRLSNPAVGTFSTGVGFDYLFPPTDLQNNQYIGQGTLVVTTYTNTQIAGTFSFTGQNNGTPVLTKNITGGSFSTTISSH